MENQGIKKRKRMHIWSSFFSDDLSYDIFYFLPWQIKSTLIIVLFLLVLPRNAMFARDFGDLWNVCIGWHLGKIGQDGASCCGLLVVKLVVKRDLVTTKQFLLSFNHIRRMLWCHFIINTLWNIMKNKNRRKCHSGIVFQIVKMKSQNL